MSSTAAAAQAVAHQRGCVAAAEDDEAEDEHQQQLDVYLRTTQVHYDDSSTVTPKMQVEADSFACLLYTSPSPRDS